MPAAITDRVGRITNSTTGRPVVAQLASPGKAIGAASININDATNWTTDSVIHFSIYTTTTVGSLTVKDSATQTDWKGTLSGTVISNLTLTGGTDREYSAGAIVEITPTARYAKDLYDHLMSFSNQDGSLVTAAVQTALGLSSSNLNGWNVLAYTPNSVTNNGNRSYILVFNGQDLTGTLYPGMRLRGTRNTTAPTQCTSLNGTSQYFSKTSPAGMTFTDDFVVAAYIKLNAYPTSGKCTIAARYNGASGWVFDIDTAGTLTLRGFNAGSGNESNVRSYQAVPLNKWVRVAAQLDMSTYSATTTNSYVMIDDIDVPAQVNRAGTNPTALIQAGDLQIGASNGANFFNGKIAQVAVFNAKVAQSTLITYTGQTMAGTETSLISAYTLSNSTTDLNTTNANNLTASGSATTTNSDSPFAQGSANVSGFTAGKEELGIVTAISFSTNTTVTIQAPEGSVWPTSGTISAVYYSANRSPYGFPATRSKWAIDAIYLQSITTSIGAINNWSASVCKLSVPIGTWELGYAGIVQLVSTVSGARDGQVLMHNSPTHGQRNYELITHIYDPATTVISESVTRTKLEDLTGATTYTMHVDIIAATGSESYSIRGDRGPFVMRAVNAYL